MQYYNTYDGFSWRQWWRCNNCELFIITQDRATFERVRYPNLCRFEHADDHKGATRVEIINRDSNASSVVTGDSRVKTVARSSITNSQHFVTTTYDGNNKCSKIYERRGKSWRDPEKLHNKYGPALLHWDKFGNITCEKYMIRGIELTREEFARVARPKPKVVCKAIERILPWPIASEICQNYHKSYPNAWPKFREERRELPDGYIKEWWLGDRHITHTYTSARMHFLHMVGENLEMEFIGDITGRAEEVTFNIPNYVKWRP